MKFKEIEKKPIAELQKMLQETRVELQDLRFKTAADQLKNVRQVRTVRKTIARLLLLISRKQQESASVKSETK